MSDISTKEKLEAYLQRRSAECREGVMRCLTDAMNVRISRRGAINDAKEWARQKSEWDYMLRVLRGEA